MSVPIIPAAAVEPTAGQRSSAHHRRWEATRAGGGFYTFEQAGFTGLAYGFDEETLYLRLDAMALPGGHNHRLLLNLRGAQPPPRAGRRAAWLRGAASYRGHARGRAVGADAP